MLFYLIRNLIKPSMKYQSYPESKKSTHSNKIYACVKALLNIADYKKTEPASYNNNNMRPFLEY